MKITSSMPSAASAGRVSGMITRMYCVQTPAPSTRATSLSSGGIAFMKFDSTKVRNPVSVTRGGAGFAVTGDGFSFTASPWTSAELAAAAHPTDLPPAGDRTRLVLDLSEHGIGTASCGPGVLPQYRLDARVVEATLVFRARVPRS